MAKKRPDIKDNLEIRAIESDNILLKFKEVTAKEVSLETCFEDALLLYNLFYKVVPNTTIELLVNILKNQCSPSFFFFNLEAFIKACKNCQTLKYSKLMWYLDDNS